MHTIRCASAPPRCVGARKPFPAHAYRRPHSRLGTRLVLAKSLVDDTSSIADLEAQLSNALSVEDYNLAARIRDSIQQRRTVGKLAVEDANKKFYDAFASGNLELMEKIVGQGDHVQVVHPGSGCIAGREQVMESWGAIMKNIRANAFRIKLEDVRVYATDDSGYVTCVEVIDADDSVGRIVATNIFERQGGAWVLVQHHGSISPVAARFR